jgi:uncharacterized protein (TIGR02147 family)
LGIDVFAFTAYRPFLLAWRDDPERRTSQNDLAREAKCSKSLLSQIFAGERDLRPHRAGTFARALGLGADEARYFEDLVVAEHGASLGVRRAAKARVLAARRFRSGQRISDPQARLFSRWYLPAIAELARCPGFRADPAWIAASLVPAISEIEAEEALATLQELGFLVPTPEGGLAPASPTWSTGSEVDEDAVAAALRAHHVSVLQLAARALTEVPPDRRQYDTLTLVTSPAAIPELKRRVAAFQMELIEICERYPPEMVAHVGLQFFPLSR